jgi:hypothetical protein
MVWIRGFNVGVAEPTSQARFRLARGFEVEHCAVFSSPVLVTGVTFTAGGPSYEFFAFERLP